VKYNESDIYLDQEMAGIKEVDKLELPARNPFETETWASVDISEENDKCIHELQLPGYLNCAGARATFGHDTIKIIVPKIEN
jgi:hypothetical protein